MIPPASIPEARDFAARLTAILACVTGLIFARTHFFAALGAPLHNRIAGASRRLATLLARLAAGTFRPRPHSPKPGAKGGPPPIHLPQGRAWLVAKLGYHVAAYASHLDFLLRDPATQTLLATAPPEALKSLGRTLRPIARLLGVDLPPALLLSPRARAGGAGGGLLPSPSKPPTSQSGRPKPPRPKLPPLLPLYPQARPRDLPFMNFAATPRPPKTNPA